MRNEVHSTETIISENYWQFITSTIFVPDFPLFLQINLLTIMDEKDNTIFTETHKFH